MTRIDTRDGRDGANPPHCYDYRVLLNREDVSTRCFLADDATGEVGLWVRDDSGHFYFDKKQNGPAVEFLSGDVVIIPPS